MAHCAAPVYVLIVCVLMVCYAALERAGVWCVSIKDLVLFIYSVQHGRKFHCLRGLYALHPIGTPCGRVLPTFPARS